MQQTFLILTLMASCLLVACEERADTPNEQPAGDAVDLADVPMRADAVDMLGKRLNLADVEWLDPDSGAFLDPPKAILVRWWTDTCPFCAMSLPAIEQLRTQFREGGLRTLAVYHPKPPRAVPAEDVLRRARELGYRGPVAADLRWETLRELYLDAGTRHSTSVSFLLDPDGVIRYVHPGPAFGPSEDPAQRQYDEDYRNLTAAIRAMLQRP